jgi:hypothetical protein
MSNSLLINYLLALTAMELLKQEAAVFLGIKERLQEATFIL